MINWRHKCIFSRPSVDESSIQRTFFDIEKFSPCRQWLRLTHEGYDFIRSFVSALSDITRPSTIIRRVISVVVNAIYREPGGANSHIAKKHIKTLPVFAKTYASFNVIPRAWVIWIFASIFHALPDLIFSGSRHSINFFFMAPARFSSIRSEVIAGDNDIITADADAVPINALVLFSRSGNNRKSRKGISSEVFEFHNILRWISLRMKSMCQPVRNPVFGNEPRHVVIIP